MTIKAIIFDMDGVLVDAKDWHYEALNEALSMFGMEISRYDHLVTFDGLSTRDKLKMLSIERGLPEGLHEFINSLKQKNTLKQVYNRCKPMFYHEYALSRLKDEGYLLAVCSNSVRQSVDVMMELTGLAGYLEFTFSNQDVSVAKPDPEMYNKAIERLGLKPDECLIVEDNEKGIAAARASNAHVLEVLEVADVNYDNLMRCIKRLEEEVA